MTYRLLLCPWVVAIIVAASCLAMQGCGSRSRRVESDRDNCLYQAQFRECMELLPAGPQRTHYNDVDDAVDACADRAYVGHHPGVDRPPRYPGSLRLRCGVTQFTPVGARRGFWTVSTM